MMEQAYEQLVSAGIPGSPLPTLWPRVLVRRDLQVAPWGLHPWR